MTSRSALALRLDVGRLGVSASASASEEIL